MDEAELIFNLFFVLLCMCIIYPPDVFLRLKLTIEQLFASLLGQEELNFVRYHQRRTSLNLFMHSCLPLFYMIVYELKFNSYKNEKSVTAAETHLDPDFPMPQAAVAFKTLVWKMTQRLILIAVCAVPLIIMNWRHQDWRKHPISRTLAKFSSDGNYTTIATDINNDCHRPYIYVKKLNNISKVIATENWIIKTSMYNVYFAHQSTTVLSVAKTETYNISQDAADTLQMISIKIQPNRTGVSDFHMRINAMEFRNVEDRIRRPINIPANIQFHRNVIDRFIDVFKEQVAQNRTYSATTREDKCFACMIAEPNIKIQKQCSDLDVAGVPLTSDNCCSNCNCKPMWCVECLARWFATKQNENEREFWLEQKCTCPMCRARFCILDVSYLQTETENVTT